MSSEKIEIVRRAVEAVNAGARTLPEFWAEDAELLPAAVFPEANLCRGREQIQRFFDRTREGLVDSTAILGECEEVGDKLLAPFEWRATGESSGAVTASAWFTVFTFRDLEIVRVEFFVERDAAIKAVGLK